MRLSFRSIFMRGFHAQIVRCNRSRRIDSCVKRVRILTCVCTAIAEMFIRITRNSAYWVRLEFLLYMKLRHLQKFNERQSSRKKFTSKILGISLKSQCIHTNSLFHCRNLKAPFQLRVKMIMDQCIFIFKLRMSQVSMKINFDFSVTKGMRVLVTY